jgi:hypothetical protein
MKIAVPLAVLILASAWAVQAMPGASAGPLKGEVLEVRDVEVYTYLRLKTEKGEMWAAVPKAAVRKGAQVSIENTMVMENFESKTLGRKFDRIGFGTLPGSGAPASPPAGNPHGGGPAKEIGDVRVAKATGPEAKTVAEVVSGRAALKGKTVLVQGKVVKYNAGIMGKNWIHLQDGSGKAADNTNDILVTTAEPAAVGDVVNARGTVRTDVDLGSGYAYAVLIEDAKLRK